MIARSGTWFAIPLAAAFRQAPSLALVFDSPPWLRRGQGVVGARVVRSLPSHLQAKVMLFDRACGVA
jgi:hypothetical protein